VSALNYVIFVVITSC